MVTSNWSREYLCWIPGNDRVMRESPIVLDGMKIRVANTTKQYLHCYIVVTILSTHMQHQNKDMLYIIINQRAKLEYVFLSLYKWEKRRAINLLEKWNGERTPDLSLAAHPNALFWSEDFAIFFFVSLSHCHCERLIFCCFFLSE